MSHAAVGLWRQTGAVLADSYGYGCAAGTAILTLDGSLPVEHLCEGDRIITRNGVRRLAAVASVRRRDASVVRVSQDSLGVGKPTEDVLLAPEQPLLIRDWRAKALFGTATALVPAFRLVDGHYIRAETAPEMRFFTLHFDHPAVIYAGGLELACAPLTVPAEG